MPRKLRSCFLGQLRRIAKGENFPISSWQSIVAPCCVHNDAFKSHLCFLLFCYYRKQRLTSIAMGNISGSIRHDFTLLQHIRNASNLLRRRGRGGGGQGGKEKSQKDTIEIDTPGREEEDHRRRRSHRGDQRRTKSSCPPRSTENAPEPPLPFLPPQFPTFGRTRRGSYIYVGGEK